MKIGKDKLRELDAWIAENVFGISIRKVKYTSGRKVVGFDFIRNDCNQPIEYYSSSNHAMDVLKKCCEKLGSGAIEICKIPTGYYIKTNCEYSPVLSETIEASICLFAKKLFSK